MDEHEARALLAHGLVGRLGTHGPDGRIDLVPVTFALLDDGAIAHAVDHKPKTTHRLQRLENVERDPRVTLLVDQWDPDDWGSLWWVRVEGTATVHAPGTAEHGAAVDALVHRYPQYRRVRPVGPAVVIEPTAWVGWAAR